MKICRPGFAPIDTDAPVQKSQGAAPTPALDENGLRLDGPTIEGFVAAGYKPENYPPSGYAEKQSPGLTEFKKSQGAAPNAGSSTSPTEGAAPSASDAAEAAKILGEAQALAAKVAAEAK